MKPTRRGLLALAASTFLPRPAAAEDDPRPCYDPEYLKWTGRREHRWPDRVGEAGFVNYYGEAFKFDAAIDVPRDRLPTCAVWGAEATTLDDPGRVRTNLHKLTVAGAPASTNCFLWPHANATDYDEKIAAFLDELRAACPSPGAGEPVRFIAVGSHHSSSDVYKRPDDAKAVMVRVDGLNHILTDRPEWKDDRFTVPYALVGAGVTVCQLNEALWDMGLALETQGSFDGQSLAGAISTGTHGAGAEHGAIADSVQAILVATCLRDPETAAGRWQIVQIEPDAPGVGSPGTELEFAL